MTVPSTRSPVKDFYRLQKNIHSFSNGEARITSFDDELTSFEVELNIKDGYYHDGLFVFEVRLANDYPIKVPEVSFKSQIFHPNIGDGYDESVVCLNLLEEDWQETNDLEDIVQGMLFLVKNPALDDALNPCISYDADGPGELEEYMEVFTKQVRQSLEGGEVEGIVFQRNPGLVQKDNEKSRVSNVVNTQNKSKTTNSTMELESSERPALGLGDNMHLPVSIFQTVINMSLKDELYRYGLYWIYRNFTKCPNHGKQVHSRGQGCPKWLTKLANSLFGRARRTENMSFFSKRLKMFQRFPVTSRTLIWSA
ncbi:NEDD8-conjugating enzyme UBC12-like [Dendronephthya gigantea]|uniref:NEDD8-conjugating enzyme UBC12-like n=1 Tax=Dendronephthya gigantea TaxID=151771 RepID=UPI00106DAEC0|nr:NEDD8-conjugating enzyme UBC12-like [Dendronephthya gigantea]